ncbi:MAG TPA: DUF1800 domain-containing protein [Pyrinomonadaceae bacterium]|nr:DUF1800 domain-containing protein [Pyrinomonadaceae bacterium]
MISRNSRLLHYILSAVFMFFVSAFPALAQEFDQNPDSPTPVLLSHTGSNRALAASSKNAENVVNPAKVRARAFRPDSRISLLITNVSLMPGEEASAFRVNAEDEKGRQYRFPVLEIHRVKRQKGVFALTVQLTDELGFWENPVFDGDVLVNVSWRGLASNRLRLGIGKIGGSIKDDTEPAQTSLSNSAGKTALNSPSPNYVGYLHSGDRTRFLEQATFGPTAKLDQRIRRVGLRTWLAEQFEAPYPTTPYPNLSLMPTNVSTDCQNNIPADCRRDFYSMYPVQNWFYKEAFYGDAQLKHRVAWALSQMWVISGVDTQQSSWMIAYHQKLAQNAFGNYRNLMTDITLNPGMGNYLDMVRSTRNNPNENFAREILQLFSIGLFMLNQDGTLQRDQNGNPIPTYDQATVNNFTKVFTGWTLCENTALCPNRTAGAPNYKDPMILNQNNHDVTAKTLLAYPGAVNQTIAANTNGTTEMNQALDNIFNHPNVAPFVSRILIQNLVTSDPTPAYVGRVAAVFNNNGSNARGDLKAVVRAVLLDPEARGNVKTDPNYGKLREPVQLATNIFRQFNVRSADGAAQSDGYVNPQVATMGQNAFNSPTVFNYYSPDYIVPGTALNGPEFGILTTGTAIARANFVNTFVFSRVNGGTTNAPFGTSIDLSEMQALAAADASGNRLLDALDTKLMHGTMSSQMKNTILAAVQAVAATDPLTRARTAVYLVATSSQYQVQR